MSDIQIVSSSGLDYRPATEVRHVIAADADKVRSHALRSEYALGDTQQKIQARL